MKIDRDEVLRRVWDEARAGCPSCGHELRPSAKFCGKCGTALTSKSKVKKQKSKGKSEDSKEKRKLQNSKLKTQNSELTVAERRQLTVMFM